MNAPVQTDLTYEQIVQLRASLARVVKTFGPAYMPLFRLLEKEVQARRPTDDSLENAIREAALLEPVE